jgi:hypothetical protein
MSWTDHTHRPHRECGGGGEEEEVFPAFSKFALFFATGFFLHFPREGQKEWFREKDMNMNICQDKENNV